MATSHHVRSNSLPSKPHPFTSQFDECLNRLKSSESASTSSSVGHSLNGLQDLYACVENLLHLQPAKQSLAQEQNKKCVQDLLDGSLVLLDMCSSAKDSLMQIKESSLDLQSILRRKRGGEFVSDEIKKYKNSRKAVKKAIHKALKNFKVKESFTAYEDHEADVMFNMLKEVQTTTFTLFKSLLSFISGSKTQSKQNGWSVVSKLMKSKRIACEKHEDEVNEFEKVDAAVYAFISHKSNNVFDLQNQLKDVEMCIQDLEEGIECLSRLLIKTRVALLNILYN